MRTWPMILFNFRTLHYSGGYIPVTEDDTDLLSFEYSEADDSQSLRFSSDNSTEITVGPVICSYGMYWICIYPNITFS
jgi:hypothetical protein